MNVKGKSTAENEKGRHSAAEPLEPSGKSENLYLQVFYCLLNQTDMLCEDLPSWGAAFKIFHCHLPFANSGIRTWALPSFTT